MRKKRQSCSVPNATIHRLPLYLEKLKMLLDAGVANVSSRELAESLDIKASQLRHDFHYFGGFSRPGRPYRVAQLVPALEEIIGVSVPQPTVIVGAGHLGQALANYGNLAVQGFPVVGVFDTDPAIIGKEMRGQLVRDIADLEAVIAERGVRIAIVAVPVNQAQKVADQLVAAGIVGLYNFAPTDLVLPDDVAVRNERVAVGLMALRFKVKCIMQAGGVPAVDE